VAVTALWALVDDELAAQAIDSIPRRGTGKASGGGFWYAVGAGLPTLLRSFGRHPSLLVPCHQKKSWNSWVACHPKPRQGRRVVERKGIEMVRKTMILQHTATA
jgi:hypothetical protein